MDEYYAIHEARYKRIIREIVEIREIGRKKKILDVGCYPYHLGEALEKMGYEVWGIASAHEPIHSPNVKICNIEYDSFPFKDNYFDLVLCTEVLEHLPQSPASALKEMYRVAKPGGILLVTTPNIARFINRIKLLLGKNVSYPLSHILEEDNIYHRHNREYTLHELVALCEHAGWKLASQGRALRSYAGYFVSYTPNRKRSKPESFLTKTAKWLYYFFVSLFPPFQDTLLVIGKK